jgi:broad specificity phosphatase PhoE
VTDEETFDAPLTKYGEDSTDLIREEFRRNVDEPIDLAVASPHRRSIQTAVLGFAGALADEGVKLHLLPAAQGVSKRLSNEGFPREKLEIEVPRLFEGNELAVKASQSVIYDDVIEGWNSKVCCYLLL